MRSLAVLPRAFSSRDQPARPVVTRQRLVRDLRALGVRRGDTLLVHASLSSIGWVDGGAQTVVAALRQTVGPTGNLVVPAATEENSMTSRAHRARIAALTPDEVRAYRQEMPAFHRNTPSGMGAVAEAVRTARGAIRSDHPQSSFAAVGPEAEYLMADHRIYSHYGAESPLAKLTKMDARVLLIGVGYRACTAFHLAEYSYTPSPPQQTYACVIITAQGKRRWTSYQDVVLDDREFEVIGQSLEKTAAIRKRDVGNAECRLVPLRDAVDFAAQWMTQNRG
jgi:aminoglycoside 3-N-acetyltransferase